VKIKRVHCVGIGGIGISAIARVLLEQGCQVTGSDLHMSPIARALADSGVKVSVGHDAAQVGDVDALLISSAIPKTNPEVAEAERRGIPVYKRSEFLGQLMVNKIGIAVAGTAGKTTTTSMLAWILTQAELDPTFIVGGVIDGLHTNAHAGQGQHFVIEADEYDRMFLGLKPTVAAITSLEHDHPDCFPTFDDMKAAFEQFIDLVPADGLIVGCGDHPSVVALLRRPSRATVQTCGMGSGNDWSTPDVWPNPLGGHDFEVCHNGSDWQCVRLQVPGVHNVQNALVALVIADWLGVEKETICRALTTFSGVGRRFQVQGEADGITVIDDYGHHPTKIRATLSAARTRYGKRPLWAVFQPHTYSRTKTLWDEFTACFAQADHVIVLDVYAAREEETLGVHAADLAAEIERADARYIPDFRAAADYIVSHVEPGAVVITLSAGDGNEVGTQVLERIGRNGRRHIPIDADCRSALRNGYGC
jgi:UDP-N-acetylmuramate--alanine ligase